MSFFIRIFTSFRFWIAVCGCVFLGLVLGDTSFIWTFQQPTYLLEKDTLGLTYYTCDTTQSECKVNFDFTSSIPLDEPASHYACLIDFGIGPTAEDAKCNPNTITFPKGDSLVHVTITHSTSNTLVREGTIRIHNPDIPSIPDTSDEGTGDVAVYSAALVWQNTTHVLSKEDGTLSEYTCDPDKADCTINPLIIPSKDGQESSALTCLVIADFDLSAGSDPCNPLQSNVPVGTYTITVQILQESDMSIVATRNIVLHHPLIDTSIDPTRVTSTFTWQSPTSLVGKEDTSLTEYSCDPEDAECKINLLITPFLDGQETSDITCLITADFELIPTLDACNPNTSLVPMGDHILTIQLLEKATNNILTTRGITLKNTPIDTSIDPLRVTSLLTWQSPTYLLQKEDITLSEYTCDPVQSECKINLLVTPLLDGTESSQLTCEITADFELIPTSDVCNPNTSMLSGGDHRLIIKIFQKSNNLLLTTREIVLKNPPKNIGGGSSGSSGGGSGNSVLDLSNTRIVIQSGLDERGVCRTGMCQVNFLAEVPSGALCHWDFGTGVFETAGTNEKCNPGYVQFAQNTSVTLIVSDPSSPTNSVTRSLAVSRESIILSETHPDPRIDIQGMLGKNKRLTEDGIRCALGKSNTCSINLTAENTLNAIHYFWSFGNGHTSERENPGAESFSLGTYRVILRATSSSGISSEIYYLVEVVESFDDLVIPCNDCEKMKGKIQISAVLANPPHADTVEWIEIKNTASETYSLDTCILSDESKKYPLSGTIAPGKTIRLRQIQTGISLGNTHEVLQIQCGDILIDTFSWDFSLPSGYILRREMLDRPPVSVSVIQTIDGDTLDILLHNKKTRVRLLGVDTPETVHPLKEIEKFGKEASDFTKKTLTGKTVWITFDHELVDHYGRTLGYIWQCDGDDFNMEKCQLFNARLISEGYARMERRFEFMYFDDFDALEKEAKKRKIGVWSDADVVKILGDLSAEEKTQLALEQEQEYLRLQQELLELAKKQCEEEGICLEEVPTWADVTKRITTLLARNLVTGGLTISGKTWESLPVKIGIFLGDDEVYSTQVVSDTLGEYTLLWYPKIPGEYRIETIFQAPDISSTEGNIVKLEKIVTVEHISDHFLVPLSGHIVVQGKMSKNRWIDADGVFHCRSRGSCSINLEAEYNRKKDITYTWALPNGEIFNGKNPPSFKIEYGDFIVRLSAEDNITGESLEQLLRIHHGAIPRASKKTSSTTSKYTIDFKDASQDIGGGVLPEVTQLSFSQSLLALFVLSVLTLLFFGTPQSIDKSKIRK